MSLQHYHYTKPQRKCSILKLTRRTAMVPLQHHRTPPENSEGILFLLRTCLKSDNFSSFINAVWWPATYNSRKWKLQLLLYTRTHTYAHASYKISILIPDYFQSGNRSLCFITIIMLHAASSIHYGSLYVCSGIIIINNQAHLFLSSPSIIFWSQPISLATSMLTHTPKRQMWETGLDPLQAHLKLTFFQTIVWQQCGYSTLY